MTKHPLVRDLPRLEGMTQLGWGGERSPAEGIFASLHAKCVVVDGRHALVTSANSTDRGQTRNLEVGILVEDPSFATTLEAQFASGSWFSRVA